MVLKQRAVDDAGCCYTMVRPNTARAGTCKIVEQ